MSGLLLAAPSSGAGKTTITLGLLRALKNRGLPLASAKSGPDYIDPRFHEAASGLPCLNLDAWAMSPARIRALAGPAPLLVEGAMGLFDGAPPDNKGASADIAHILDLPVILIIDAARMSGSVAALALGFANFDPKINVAGVILNNVGSPRHEAMLRRALAPTNLTVFGALHRQTDLHHPSRHLGLVQASEHDDLDKYLDRAAALVEQALDIEAIYALAQGPSTPQSSAKTLTPPAQHICVAKDAAFAFIYPHILQDWRANGAEITFVSPLADEKIPPCDFVFLSGGYPELHAEQLANSHQFFASLRATEATIYGECGGYMALGDGLVDATGKRHQMAGLLRLETSYKRRKLHLGYRDLQGNTPLLSGRWKGHEFHYATTLSAHGPPPVLRPRRRSKPPARYGPDQR